ncbi:MAG: hypothetical protein ACPL7B_12010 [Candidatus Poribacteria bacterium]
MRVKIIFHSVNCRRNGSEWSDVAWHYHESKLIFQTPLKGRICGSL